MPGKTLANIKKADISAIPAKAGIRYYLGGFYGAGEIGGIFFLGNNSRTGLAYSLGLGDKFTLGNTVFDIGLRHEGWSTAANATGIVALRVACEFTLKEIKNKRIIRL